jgi:hypothetical protein
MSSHRVALLDDHLHAPQSRGCRAGQVGSAGGLVKHQAVILPFRPNLICINIAPPDNG